MAARQVDFAGFIGASYLSRSLAADGEESINIFPETVESRKSKSSTQMVMYRTPGLLALHLGGDALTGPVHGMFAFSSNADSVVAGVVIDTAVVVAGPPLADLWDVYRYFAVPGSNPPSANLLHIGQITNPGTFQYVSFAANDFQVLIVSNPNGYIYDALTGNFAQITDDGYNGGVTATCVDGYFVVNNPNANSFSVSAFNDGTTWSGLDQESTQDYPDTLRAVANYGHYLQLFSGRRSECYYDTGSNSALFARYEGSYQYQGIAAPWSVAFCDNSPFYLGQNEMGAGVVYRLVGFTPTRVSNMAMESQIQSYVNIQDAYSWSYQDGGHSNYVCHFPSALVNPLYAIDNTQPKFLGVTWVYDATVSGTTQISTWHKRQSWNPNTGQYTAHAGRFYMYAGGNHLVGDFATAAIYRMSMDYSRDNGAPIRWVRTSPHVSSQMVRNVYRWFQLDMQTGTGLSENLPDATVILPGWGQSCDIPASGEDPTISVNISDDGGESFDGEMQMGVGKIGKYRRQATVNNLGEARDLVVRVFSTDPTMNCFVNAFLGVDVGTN